MLNLGDALGFVVLIGVWGTRADGLRELLDAPPLLLVDPPDGIAMGHGLSGIRAGTTLPLASGAARAVATDRTDPARVADAARVTRVGGRLVALAESRAPEGVREHAREETVLVVERLPQPCARVTLPVGRGLPRRRGGTTTRPRSRPRTVDRSRPDRSCRSRGA
jgi:hypothetical protein